jgi:hypothetical protein
MFGLQGGNKRARPTRRTGGGIENPVNSAMVPVN